VNLNLFLAAVWAVVGFGILVLMPDVEQNPTFNITPERRYMLGGLAWVLMGWNIVRWRMRRLQRQVEEESRYAREPVRRSRPDDPPNPDFDFSDPKPGGGPHDPPQPPRSG
jgi:hypothetical protein